MSGGLRDTAESTRSFIGSIRDGTGIRVAVKDILDTEGEVTSAGSKVVAERAKCAERDATCLSRLRLGRYSYVGKTNLHELAFGTTGINTWSGTPKNRLGDSLIPGGSSSGNGSALAYGLCDIAIGSDTGGSVRNPSACNAVMGLKTTYDLISREGLYPLAPSLDTVGPMTRDITMMWEAMSLLGLDQQPEGRLKRILVLPCNGISTAVEAVLASVASDLRHWADECDIDSDDWTEASNHLTRILWAEAAESNYWMKDRWGALQVGESLQKGLSFLQDRATLEESYTFAETWKRRLDEVLEDGTVLVVPTLERETPSFGTAMSGHVRLGRFTSPVNLAGVPALSVPIRISSVQIPVSVQLIGRWDSEKLLLTTAEKLPSRFEWGNQP